MACHAGVGRYAVVAELRGLPTGCPVAGVARQAHHEVSCGQPGRTLAVVTSLALTWLYPDVVVVIAQRPASGASDLQVGHQASQFRVYCRLAHDWLDLGTETSVVVVAIFAIVGCHARRILRRVFTGNPG